MIDMANHPWMSGLLGDEEMTALLSPEAALQRYLQVEAAWSVALRSVAGCADVNSIADRIMETTIKPEDLKDGFGRDGLPIPALVTLLKVKLGPEASPWIHKGLTSQDVMDTALMLTMREVLALLNKRLIALDESLAVLEDRFRDAPIMAFTRMQPALETTGGDIIARWRQPLPSLLVNCNQLSHDIAIIQWGGPIGKRDVPDAEKLAEVFANQLQLKDPGSSWHTDRTVITNIAHFMMRIATATGKMGEDIALMAALGPDQISLTGGTSSAMPHKNNPIKAEALISLCDYATNLQTSLNRSARHEASRSGQAWMLEWLTLPQMCVTIGASLLIANRLMSEIHRLGRSA